jgi:hypothetical protein
MALTPTALLGPWRHARYRQVSQRERECRVLSQGEREYRGLFQWERE